MLSDIIGTTRYDAAMKCLTNDAVIASLYVISDLILALSLVACAVRVWTKHEDGYMLLPFQCQLVAVCTMFLALGHFIDIVTLFEADYRLEVLTRAAAAGVSVIIAFSFWSRP